MGLLLELNAQPLSHIRAGLSSVSEKGTGCRSRTASGICFSVQTCSSHRTWHAAILSPAQIFRCHEALKPQKHEMLEPGKRYGCTLPLSDILSWPSGQIFIDFYLTCN